jgi:hypothetical protein
MLFSITDICGQTLVGPPYQGRALLSVQHLFLPTSNILRSSATVSSSCHCFSELPLFQRASSTAAVSARNNKIVTV